MFPEKCNDSYNLFNIKCYTRIFPVNCLVVSKPVVSWSTVSEVCLDLAVYEARLMSSLTAGLPWVLDL